MLGMPQATAYGRLRKALLLRLLQRLDEDKCSKCGEVFDDPAEISVDHMQPWRDGSAELFWDLDNVVFTHVRCNKTDRHRGWTYHKRRQDGPSGTAWCSGHQDFHAVSEFYKSQRGLNGLSNLCKDLDRARRNKYR